MGARSARPEGYIIWARSGKRAVRQRVTVRSARTALSRARKLTASPDAYGCASVWGHYDPCAERRVARKLEGCAVTQLAW